MALVFADRVLETCSAPGTGSVSLLGATTGYRTFSAAVGNANTCYYTIADQSGANWEVGLGTYATAGNTLARTTVLSSSNSGSLVNFSSGTQNVFLDYPAGTALAVSGSGTSGQVLTSAGSGTLPTWATPSGGGGGTATGSSYTNPTAAGTAAAAFGTSASAGSNYSTSLGANSSNQGSVTATGAGSMALGGSYASGTNSFAAAVANNTSSYGAKTVSSITMGNTALSSGNYGIAIGYGAVASGSYSVAIGGTFASASGANSFCFGGSSSYTSASGTSSVAFGDGASASQNGKYAFTGIAISGVGSSQYGKIVISAATTTTASVVLTSDGGAASTTNQLVVASSQAMAISGTLIGKNTANGNMVAYNITGAVSNNAGTMASTGLALNIIGTDSIVLGSAPTITVDSTNKAIAITSGYKSATSIHWVATIHTSEVI